ncbi:MAG: hypothetical protein NTY74_13840 [Ignavibacteriae bacterium]|nr:hypothetical protein [Ignavibacteriota bacterium]
MSITSNVFNAEYKELSSGNYLHLINIEEIDTKLETYIDESIAKICEGNTDINLYTIKKRLIKFLTSKIGTNLEIGAIAEFFTHLYLNEIGFKQEFLFLNLEEESIKKGFDGYYSYLNEEWIFESKSGSISTDKISHKNKIKEAYTDLKDKISGDVKNNPWQNAYNHASHIDVDSSSNIRNNLKILSEEFTNDVTHDIDNFNIIPGSTIFLEGNWESINTTELEIEINKLILKFNFNKINVICVNKKSLSLFWDYLNK